MCSVTKLSKVMAGTPNEKIPNVIIFQFKGSLKDIAPAALLGVGKYILGC
jgi:hypothetical protein